MSRRAPSHPMRHHTYAAAHDPASRQCPPPPTPFAASRRRVSLVRHPSGRHMWWMERGVSSPRTEAMMRRRMKFLEEEAKDAAEVLVNGGKLRVHGGRPEEGSRRRMGRDSSNSDAIVASETAFSDMMTDIATRESSASGFEMEKRHISENDPHVISIDKDEQSSKAAVKFSLSRSYGEQILLYCHQNNIHVVQLSENTIEREIYLDFGAENVVGTMTCRLVLVRAPITVDNGLRVFHVHLDQSTRSTGIVWSENIVNDGLIEESNSETNRLDPIKLKLTGGESKIIYIMWTPVENGCVRESFYLKVKYDEVKRWKQSFVIVGKACAMQEEQMSNNQEFSIRSSTSMESNMISEITDKADYSQVGMPVCNENDAAGNLAMEDEYCSTEEKIFEEDSIKVSSPHSRPMALLVEKNMGNENDDVQGMKTEESMDKIICSGATMVSLELSQIDEVDDNDTHDEAERHKAQYSPEGHAKDHSTFQTMNEVSTSLSSILFEDSGTAAPLVPTYKAIVPAGTYSCSSIRNELSPLHDMPDIWHHLNASRVSPGKPQYNDNTIKGGKNGAKGVLGIHSALAQRHPKKDSALPYKHKRNIWAVKEASVGQKAHERGAAMTPAEKLGQEIEESLRSEEMETDHFLAEEERARAEISWRREEQRNELENLFALEDLVLREAASDDSEYSHKKSTAQSVGSLGPNDNIGDGYETIPGTKMNNHFLLAHHDRHSPVAPLARCLAELQENLVNSPDNDSDTEVSSPNKKLILNFTPSRNFGDEKEASILNKMTEQVTDDVNRSPEISDSESETEQFKTELNTLIEGVSELEEVTQKQHYHTTNSTSHDLHTQLEHVNQEMDAITPISAQWKSSAPRSKAVKSYSGKNGIETQLPTAAMNMAHQRSCFFTTPKNNESLTDTKKDSSLSLLEQRPERDGDKKPAEKQIANPINNDAMSISSSKKTAMLPEDNLRTTQKNETKDCMPGNSLQLQSAKHIQSTITPRKKLMANKQRNATKSSARKCYFFKSPSSSKAKVRQSDAKENKKTYPGPSPGPQGKKACIKNVSRIREQKSQDKGSPMEGSPEVPKRRRNGYSLQINHPSPRELRAYEKHIHTRERLRKK